MNEPIPTTWPKLWQEVEAILQGRKPVKTHAQGVRADQPLNVSRARAKGHTRTPSPYGSPARFPRQAGSRGAVFSHATKINTRSNR